MSLVRWLNTIFWVCIDVDNLMIFPYRSGPHLSRISPHLFSWKSKGSPTPPMPYPTPPSKEALWVMNHHKKKPWHSTGGVWWAPFLMQPWFLRHCESPANLCFRITEFGHCQCCRTWHHRSCQQVICRDVEGDISLQCFTAIGSINSSTQFRKV